MNSKTITSLESIRLDKWLWAARFFKTRKLAKTAIENGRVRIAGHKLKPGKEIKAGFQLQIKQGDIEKTVDIIALSNNRESAPKAALLYFETDESIKNRKHITAKNKALFNSMPQPVSKPNKKQRREIIRFSKKSD